MPTVGSDSTTFLSSGGQIATSGGYTYTNVDNGITFEVFANPEDTSGKSIHPLLYFSYIKRKFKLLEKRRLNARLLELQKAYEVATDNGQMLLGERFMKDLIRETRESVLYAKGIRYSIEKDELWKYKNKIKGGHISDTKLQDYSRVIPSSALKKITNIRKFFDDIVILHYYNPEQKDLTKMSAEERSKTKDPVAFGKLNQAETKWYFICDWTDEYCDLTFEQVEKAVRKFDIRKPHLLKAVDC